MTTSPHRGSSTAGIARGLCRWVARAADAPTSRSVTSSDAIDACSTASAELMAGVEALDGAGPLAGFGRRAEPAARRLTPSRPRSRAWPTTRGRRSPTHPTDPPRRNAPAQLHWFMHRSIVPRDRNGGVRCAWSAVVDIAASTGPTTTSARDGRPDHRAPVASLSPTGAVAPPAARKGAIDLHARFGGGDEFSFLVPTLPAQRSRAIARASSATSMTFPWQEEDPRLADRPVRVDVGSCACGSDRWMNAVARPRARPGAGRQGRSADVRGQGTTSDLGPHGHGGGPRRRLVELDAVAPVRRRRSAEGRADGALDRTWRRR